MRNIIEVPLIASDGKKIGKVQIDKKGQLRIKMRRWIKPGDFARVVSLLQGLNRDMINHKYTRQIDSPSRWRRGFL
jgi:hypothetical protein